MRPREEVSKFVLILLAGRALPFVGQPFRVLAAHGGEEETWQITLGFAAFVGGG